MTTTNRIYSFIFILLASIFMRAQFFVSAQEKFNPVDSILPTVRLVDNDASLVKHGYAFLDSVQFRFEDIDLILKKMQFDKTLIVVCTTLTSTPAFECDTDSVTSLNKDSHEVVLESTSSLKIALVNRASREYIVVPENVLLNSDSNLVLYDYLKTYGDGFETSLSQAKANSYTGISLIIRRLLKLLLLMLSIFMLWILTSAYNRKALYSILITFKKFLDRANFFSINAYVSLMGIVLMVIGAGLLSVNDTGHFDLLYVINWISSAIEDVSWVTAPIILGLLFLYTSIFLNAIFVIYKIAGTFEKSLFSDFVLSVKRFNIKFVIILSILFQITSIIFLPSDSVYRVSIVILTLLLLIIYVNKDHKVSIKDLSRVGQIIVGASVFTYVVVIYLYYIGLIGNSVSEVHLGIDDSTETVLSPYEANLVPGGGSQYVTSNGPIFVDDVLVFHPQFKNISYVEYSAITPDMNAFFIESNEYRLLKSLAISKELNDFEISNDSNYFHIEGNNLATKMDIIINCSTHPSADLIQLWKFNKDSYKKDPIFFFPGCYRSNLTFHVSLPQKQAIISDYIYKLAFRSSSYLDSLSIDGVDVNYLNFSNIINRNNFTFLINGNMADSQTVFVGTTEGSYLNSEFSQIINSSREDSKINLTPILTYLFNHGVINETSIVKLDSTHSGIPMNISF